MNNKTNTDNTKDHSQPDCDNHSFRIAHLSDLHFGTQFNIGHWKYVKLLLLKSYTPDIVVVTGDLVDTPSFFFLGLARKQLAELEEELQCPVITIPGNHDVGIFGNLAIPPWNTMYRIVFSNENKAIFDGMPTFLDFSKMNKRMRWYLRLNYFHQFTKQYLSGSLNNPRLEKDPILKPDFGEKTSFPIVLAGFNSNTKLLLASGRVGHRAILSLQGGLQEIEELALCPRIALIHHHLIPIPYSNTKESATSFEPFLVLRNAGTLLHNLLLFDFDLVLHGHKHYSNYARLFLDTHGDSSSEIAIISSASSTLDETSAGANSFNIIDILPNGLITYEPVLFGAGKASISTLTAASSTRKRLFSIESCKKRTHRKAVNRLNCEIELEERYVEIDEQGNAEFQFSVKGYRIFHGANICKPQFVLSVRRGAIVPSSVSLNEDSERQSHQLKIDRSDPPKEHLEIPVELGHDTPDIEKGVSFGVKLRTVNNYLITKWEAKEIESQGYRDFIGIPIRQPTRELLLKVSLPNGFNPKPHVWVERLKGYPLLTFVDERKEVKFGDKYLDKDETDETKKWVYDFEMTQYESCNLKKITSSGQPKSENNLWELRVRNPMLGFIYSIRWDVNTDNKDRDTSGFSNAIQFRKTLINLLPQEDLSSDLEKKKKSKTKGEEILNNDSSQKTLSPDLEDIKLKGQEMLEKIFSHLLLPKFKTAGSCHDEKIEASIFIYDNFVSSKESKENKEDKTLKMVFKTSDGNERQRLCKKIPFYEGVAGAAFRTRIIQMYVQPQLVGKEDESAYVFYHDNEQPSSEDKYTCLISIPLYLRDSLEDSVISPEEVIGVFNLGTNAHDSSLLKLIKQDSNTDQDVSKLGAALWFIALSYINGLAEFTINLENDKSKNPEQKSKKKKSNQNPENKKGSELEQISDNEMNIQSVFLEARKDGLFMPEENLSKKIPMSLTAPQRHIATETIKSWINHIVDQKIGKEILKFLSID